MHKEIVSDRQGISMIIMFLFGSTLLMGTGGSGKKEAWLSVLLAMLAAFFIFLVYAEILSLFPKKDLFDILQIVHGKVLGKILSFIYLCFSIHLGALVISNFGQFTQTVGLPETPPAVVITILILLCIWVVKEGIEVLGRWSELFVRFLFVLVAFTLSASTTQMELTNLQPFLYEGIAPVLKGALASFSFPFGETVLFLLVLSSLNTKRSPFKVYSLGLLIGGGIIFLLSLRTILVLGEVTAGRHYFPPYVAVSRIDIGDFLTRLELAVSISFFTTGFVKISVCLLGASKGVSKLFNFTDYRFCVAPIGLFMLSLSRIAYENMLETKEFVTNVWPYYALIFQVILPLFTYLVLKIKLKHRKIPMNTGQE